jgi:AraC-like DNA-binding protein
LQLKIQRLRGLTPICGALKGIRRTLTIYLAFPCPTIMPMDTLSTLLADVRIRDARFVRARFDAGGQLSVDLSAGQAQPGRQAHAPIFHIVTNGRLWLRPQRDAAAILMQAGDVAFFPRGQAHALCGQPVPPARGAQAIQPYLAQAGAGPSEELQLPLDDKGHGTRHAARPLTPGVGRAISGSMHIDGVTDAWLWGALPPYLLVRWSERALPHWLQIGLAYLEQELARDQLARQAIINRLGDILFIQALRSYLDKPGAGEPAQADDPSSGWLIGLKDGMVSKVIGAMHKAPERAWTLQALASIACVSRSVLAERFAELVGQTPLAYLTRHRMHLAARRLRQSHISVAELAGSVGYQSAAAFTQAFKREFGCPPRTFKAQAEARAPVEQAASSNN